MVVLTENPGRPIGSRPEDDEEVLKGKGRSARMARLPWIDRTDEEPPKLRASEKPRRTIPGGPGPDDQLPCAGRYDLFDTEEPTPEALSLCASCPFRDWCLQTATENSEWWTWAGTTHEDRKPKNERKAA